MEYPQDYQDPLEGINVSEAENWSSSMGLKEGAGNYIKHLNDHVVACGMCFKKDDIGERNKEWERVYGTPYPRG